MKILPRINKLAFKVLPIAAALVFTSACGSDAASPIGTAHAAEGIRIAAPKAPIVEPKGIQTAVFAGGCFWGIEGVFERVKGVTSVESGYSGGTKASADYDLVSGLGDTPLGRFGRRIAPYDITTLHPLALMIARAAVSDAAKSCPTDPRAGTP